MYLRVLVVIERTIREVTENNFLERVSYRNLKRISSLARVFARCKPVSHLPFVAVTFPDDPLRSAAYRDKTGATSENEIAVASQDFTACVYNARDATNLRGPRAHRVKALQKRGEREKETERGRKKKQTALKKPKIERHRARPGNEGAMVACARRRARTARCSYRINRQSGQPRGVINSAP